MPVAQSDPTFSLLALVAGWVILLFVAGLGAVILYAMVFGKIDLAKLISEPNGDASMSRLQLLIFTFVIAVSLFLIILYNHGFPSVIPQGVLVLLGISSSSYLVSKGIQFSSEAGATGADPSVIIVPQRASVKIDGPTFAFQAKTVALQGGVKWTLPPNSTNLGTINEDTGLYTPPKAPAAGQPPIACPYVEVHATSVDNPSVMDVAVVHLI
jgi:hypothetical protein